MSLHTPGLLLGWPSSYMSVGEITSSTKRLIVLRVCFVAVCSRRVRLGHDGHQRAASGPRIFRWLLGGAIAFGGQPVHLHHALRLLQSSHGIPGTGGVSSQFVRLLNIKKIVVFVGDGDCDDDGDDEECRSNMFSIAGKRYEKLERDESDPRFL